MADFDSAILSDSDKFSQYIETDQHVRLINRWQYYGKTNNHAEFTKISKNLADISSKLTPFNKDKVLPFYTEIVEVNNLKLVYRSLNQQKSHLTVATIHILNNLINDGYINLLVNSFNFELSFLSKLVLKNDIIRKEFITFWLNLLSNMNFLDRKNLLVSKVWLNIFKNLHHDDEEIGKKILQFIESKIIHESNFTKFTKLKFLNETCLFNLQNNLEKPGFYDIFPQIINEKFGILFSDPPNHQISINTKSFKINNKVLYNLLTFLKLDSINKINLITLILSSDHNLIDPYMNYLVLNYGNDLTNHYSYNLLFTNILKLDTIKVPNILLKPINKNSLIKNLSSESSTNDYIKYMNLTLVYLMLNKLSSPHLSVIEINTILNNLPSINEILKLKNYSTNNDIISLLILKILDKLSNFELNNSLVKYLNNELNNLNDVKGVKFNKLNYLIKIQINLSNKFQVKTINYLSNIVKFSNESDKSWSFYDLLNKLIPIPNDNLLSPFWSFIYLEYPDDLLPLLVELNQRLNTNIYKYIDLPFNLHLIVKIFIEQYSIYKQKNGDKFDNWFNQLINNFFIIGQDWNQLQSCLKHFGLSLVPKDLSLPGNASIGEMVMNNNFQISNKFIIDDFELMCLVRKYQALPKLELLEKILNYLTSEHINNLNLFKILTTSINDVSHLNLFNSTLMNLNVSNQEIPEFIFQQMQHGKLSILNWLLNFDQLNYKFDEDIQLSNYRLLLSKGIEPNITIDELFTFKHADKLSIIKSKLTETNLMNYIEIIVNTNSFQLLENIELSNEVIDILKSKSNLSLIGSFITSSNPKLSELFQKVSLPSSKSERYLKLINNILKFNPSLIDDSVINKIYEQQQYSNELQLDLIDILRKYPNIKIFNNILITTTKNFAEDTIPSNFIQFLNKFTQLFTVKVYNEINIDVINTQLEVIVQSSYINNYEYLTYINRVIMSFTTINSKRLLQIFLHNPDNELHNIPNNLTSYNRIESSLVIYNLFNLDHEGNLTILKPLISMYSGSIRFEDLIIKNILNKIESLSNINWINLIENWEINEFNYKDLELIGNQKLINNNLISLNKNFIKNIINNHYNFNLPFIQGKNKKLSNNYLSIIDYINDNIFKISYDYGSTIYDFEFLILLIINNDEFFKFESDGKVIINFTNLINYNILEILVLNYNNKISKIIINNLVKNLSDDFKDKNLFKIYLSNLINTYRTHELTNIQLKIYSSFISILSNPGNYLYEIIFKYILSNPVIKINELPNFNKIKLETLKSIEWYLNNFEMIKTQDLKALNKNKFFEWIFNLLTNTYISNSLKEKIEKILFHLPEIDGGSTTLITKYGGLTFIDQININPQIAVKLGITNSKRLMDWTNDDLPNQVKRIKH